MSRKVIGSIARALSICSLVLLLAIPAFGEYRVVRANFHVHTLVSAGVGERKGADHRFCVSPNETLEKAQSQFLWVVGLSDHGSAITTDEWAQLDCAVKQCGTMVGLRGFEWTYCGPTGYDHINVFGTTSYTDAPPKSTRPFPKVDVALTRFYDWLRNAATSPEFGRPIAQFNHIMMGTHFNRFAKCDDELRDIFCLAEIGSGEFFYPWMKPTECEEPYQTALCNGWHVAPSIGIDNQFPPGPDAARRHTAIWVVPDSGRAGVIEAIRARRIFASEDRNAKVSFECTIDGETSSHWMGETVYPGPNDVTLNLSIDIGEERSGTRPRIEGEFVMVPPGRVIRSFPPPEDRKTVRSRLDVSYKLTPKMIDEMLGPERKEICIYARVRQKGSWIENDHFYTAPIWISRDVPPK